MNESELSDLKTVCIAIVDEVDPEDTFIVKTQFDELCALSGRSVSQKEGRFLPPEVMVNFGAALVAFLLAVFTDAVKDVLKKRVAEALKRLFITKEKLGVSEQLALRTQVFDEIDRTKLAEGEKTRLREGFAKLLSGAG